MIPVSFSLSSGVLYWDSPNQLRKPLHMPDAADSAAADAAPNIKSAITVGRPGLRKVSGASCPSTHSHCRHCSHVSLPAGNRTADRVRTGMAGCSRSTNRNVGDAYLTLPSLGQNGICRHSRASGSAADRLREPSRNSGIMKVGAGRGVRTLGLRISLVRSVIKPNPMSPTLYQAEPSRR